MVRAVRIAHIIIINMATGKISASTVDQPSLDQDAATVPRVITKNSPILPAKMRPSP